MNSAPIGWAIVGTGRIAARFAGSLARSKDARLAAVVSRDAGRATAFAAAQGAPEAHCCIDPAEAATPPGVQAAYIATPHSEHHVAALAALHAGKAVLCEKPMTLNARDTGALVTVARARGVFLMEAMWTRCLPAVRQVQAWVREGRIGEPRLVSAGFGFGGTGHPHRLTDPTLGGGALLDVGVYPIAYAMMVYGAEPATITGCARLGPTGVDEVASISLAFPGGGLAALNCAYVAETDKTLRIHGTRGSISSDLFWRATSARLEPTAEPVDTFYEEPLVDGFDHQLAEVHRCLRAGLLQSPLMTWEDSLALARTTDTLRRQWGVVYPGDPGV